LSAVETVSEGLCEFRSAMQILNIIKLLFVSLSLLGTFYRNFR